MAKKNKEPVVLRVEHRTGSGTTVETQLVPSDKAKRLFDRNQRRTHHVGRIRDNS
jgi:hypothetical protein